MAPPGPPPYTIDQINAMSTKEERLRARAELNSYIARMKKEQQDRLARTSNGYTAHTAPAYTNSTDNYVTRGRGTYNNSYRGAPQRGGYTYGGRGASSYHPYQRQQPPHTATKFKNRTVVFNKPHASAEASGTESISAPGSAPLSNAPSRQNSQPPEPKALCATFTSTGVCTRHGCPLLHDPNKQALCKRWLFKNDCNRGDHCSLSHEPTPHNVPTCLHFQEGRCTNEDCRFAHIRVNPAAQICDAFGRLGYCEKGAECADLHAYECPDFANKGECIRGDKCQHRHVHRASRMRKSTGRSSPEDLSRATSPEVGSNNPETHGWATKSSASQAASHTPHLFTQQVDYVPFDIED